MSVGLVIDRTVIDNARRRAIEAKIFANSPMAKSFIAARAESEKRNREAINELLRKKVKRPTTEKENLLKVIASTLKPVSAPLPPPETLKVEGIDENGRKYRLTVTVEFLD